MPSMPSAWEEHGRFIPSKASHTGRLGLSTTHYVGRDVNALFVALDANFRLRRRAVSSNEKDPSLSEGWGYFVEDTAFKAYLNDHKNVVQEVCTYRSDVPILTHFNQEKHLF